MSIANPGAPPDPGGRLTDLLLEREAALIRAGIHPVPHDFAGLVISDDEIDALLGGAGRDDEWGGRAPEAATGDRSAHEARDETGDEGGHQPYPTGFAWTDWDAAIELARLEFERSLAEDRQAANRLSANALSANPLATVVRVARLDPTGAQLLAMLVSVELDGRRQRLAAFVQNDVNRPRLTLALIARLFGATGLGVVAPNGPLRAAALIQVKPDSPWSASQIVPAPALCWAVAVGRDVGGSEPDLGIDILDIDLSDERASAAPPGSSLPSAAPPAAGGYPEPHVLLVTGADPARRRQMVAGVGLSRLAITRRPETPEGWEALICHATVSSRTPMLETDALSPADRGWLERASHLSWVISSDRDLPLDCLPRRSCRELYAGDHVVASDREWQLLAGRPRPAGTRLNRTQLELVAPILADRGDRADRADRADQADRASRGDQADQADRAKRADEGEPGEPPEPAQRGKPSDLGGPPTGLPAALRRLASGHLDQLTRRVRPRRSWADLVVDEEQRDGLRLLCARWRHRDQVYEQWGFSAMPSAGVVALFSGPSGTGKTLAAEVVAAELGLDLYRLDISSVVSKYIGETEKNLEQVFAAASAAEVVLFFDEADALFGRRSEVSDAHDRYANIEVAYLLQRLEEHDGLIVLATNLQQNIDPAFLRRIDVLVSFPEPDHVKRRALWQRSFGPDAPVDGIDFDWMAERFELTGGEIRNVALEAAFRAAYAGEPISMAHLMAAMRREMRKAGRLCNREDFAHWLHTATSHPATSQPGPSDPATPNSPATSEESIGAAAAR